MVESRRRVMGRLRLHLLLGLLVALAFLCGCRKGALEQLKERGWIVTGTGRSLTLTTRKAPPADSTVLLKRLRGDFAAVVGQMAPQVEEWGAAPHLIRLTIDDHALRDISFLRNFHALSNLNLSGTDVSDIQPLAGLRGLRDLSLNSTPVRDIRALSGLHELSRLDLENTQVSSVAPLRGLQQLKLLSVRGSPVRDLSSLAHLPNLKIEADARN